MSYLGFEDFPLTPDQARGLVRKAVEEDDSRQFYSTLEGEDGFGITPRTYSGHTVKVIEEDTDNDVFNNGQRLWIVEAADNVRFTAWEDELNGFIFDTAQWVGPR